jgi:pimeloyl-ACP methyl ester carboxylesterase
LSQRLYRIRAQTMLIWGESDRMISPVYAEAFKAGIAGAHLVTIPEAGHMAPVEQTAKVIEALQSLS